MSLTLLSRSKLFALSVTALIVFAACVAWTDENIVRTDIGPMVPSFTAAPRFSYGVMFSYRSVQGTFDPYGDYTSLADGTSINMVSTIFNGAYRLTRAWQLAAMLPLNYVTMITPTGNSSIYTLGSPTFTVKYHFQNALHLSVDVGTGIPARTHWGQKNGEPAAAASLDNDMGNAGGRGPDIHTGFGMWEIFHRFKGSFQGVVAFPFAQSMTQNDIPDGPTMMIQRGVSYQIAEGASYLYNKRWNLNLSLKQSWALNSRVDGELAEGTASRLFMSGFGFTYSQDEKWRYSASYETPWPFYAYVVNQPYAPSISAGVTYAGL